MNITSINDKRNMTYNHYFKQPLQAVELKLNIIIAENPILINSLYTYNNHYLIRIFSESPPRENYDHK